MLEKIIFGVFDHIPYFFISSSINTLWIDNVFCKKSILDWHTLSKRDIGLSLFKPTHQPAFMAQHLAHPPSVGKVMDSMLGPNRVITKDVKCCTSCCYVRWATLILWVVETPWPLNRRNSLPYTVRTSRQSSCNQRVGCLQFLGSRVSLLTLGCAINRLVVCFLVWLGSMKGMFIGLAQLSIVVVRMAIKLSYRNNSPVETIT